VAVYYQKKKDQPLIVLKSVCPKCRIYSNITVRKKGSSGCVFFLIPFMWNDSTYLAHCSFCGAALNVNQSKMEQLLGNYGVGRGLLQSEGFHRIQDPNIDDKDLFY